MIESAIVERFSKSFSKVVSTLIFLDGIISLNLFFFFLKIPVIGNNDVTPHNNVSEYDIEYTNFQRIWYDAYNLDFGYHFIKGGYYTQEISPKLRTINLNTMVFSKKNKLLKEDCDVPDSQGRTQMDWLRKSLEDARSQNAKVYLL